MASKSKGNATMKAQMTPQQGQAMQPAAAPQTAAVPSPAKGAPSQKGAQPAGKGGMPIKLIGGVIAVLVIIGVAYYVYSNYVGVSGSQLYSILSAKQLNTTELQAVVAKNINASPTFNVSYAGQVVVNGTGSSLGGITLTIPFTYSLLRYHNDTRSAISLRDVPLFGNLSTTAISLMGGAKRYACVNSTLTLFTSNKSKGYECTLQTSTQATSGLNFSNLSAISRLFKENLTVSKLGLGSYQGLPCDLATITGTVTGNSSASSAGLIGSDDQGSALLLNMDVCFSTVYSVPLNATIMLRSKNTSSTSLSYISIALHETGIGGPVTDAQVTTLPGPIVNTTSPYTSGGTTTVSNYTLPQSNYTAPTLPPGATLQSTLSAQGTISYDDLAALVDQNFNTTTSTYTATYLGNVTTGAGTASAFTQMENITFLKYYQNVTSYSIQTYSNQFGTTTTAFATLYLNNDASSYLCSSVLTKSVNYNYTCYQQQASIETGPGYMLSLTGLSPITLPNMVLSSSGQKMIDGQSCTLLTGAGQLSGDIFNSSVSMAICISSKYNVPLNISITQNTDIDGTITATTTALTGTFTPTATKAQVTTLPGKLLSQGTV